MRVENARLWRLIASAVNCKKSSDVALAKRVWKLLVALSRAREDHNPVVPSGPALVKDGPPFLAQPNPVLAREFRAIQNEALIVLRAICGAASPARFKMALQVVKEHMGHVVVCPNPVALAGRPARPLFVYTNEVSEVPKDFQQCLRDKPLDTNRPYFVPDTDSWDFSSPVVTAINSQERIIHMTVYIQPKQTASEPSILPQTGSACRDILDPLIEFLSTFMDPSRKGAAPLRECRLTTCRRFFLIDGKREFCPNRRCKARFPRDSKLRVYKWRARKLRREGGKPAVLALIAKIRRGKRPAAEKKRLLRLLRPFAV